MLLAEVVAVSVEVAATRSRTAKIAVLAGLLGRTEPGEVRTVAAWLSGETLQGKVGIGPAGVRELRAVPASETSMTVADVIAVLDRMAGLTGAKSTRTRRAEFWSLLESATREEGRFLRRLVTGELRQGALEGLMIEAVASAAAVPADAVRRAFMLSGRLPETAAVALGVDVPPAAPDRATPDPVAALAAVGLEVGRPVRPMLATAGVSIDGALTELGADVVVEQKMDGARIQVHRRGDEVRVFTRTLRDITDSVPELVAGIRALSVDTVVLDGETLALRDDGRPRPFQETMGRFGAQTPNDVVLQPWFFDCLHRDGVDLVDEPLAVRRAALAEVVPDNLMPAVERPSPDEARVAVADALAAGHEGSMVKALDSVYSAGRRGRSWQKVKPSHTLDLVVLAAEWGSGRRQGWLSNIHLGARDGDGFVMIGKTFKGMTDETLRWQTATFPEHEVSRSDWTVHLRPEIVVEIEIDGVQTSTRYPGGVALRFARVVRYRDDKPAAEADTIDAVRALLV